MYDDSRMFSFFPNVLKITIEADENYPCAVVGKVIKENKGIAVYNPNSNVNFTYNCINRDCTKSCFDLYNIVSSMISHKVTYSSGTICCNGQEAKDHSNRCPCELIYTINIVYRS